MGQATAPSNCNILTMISPPAIYNPDAMLHSKSSLFHFTSVVISVQTQQHPSIAYRHLFPPARLSFDPWKISDWLSL